MEDSFYAPIIIPTLNRYEHFVRCFESLERCTGADKTELYVGLDYPPAEKYVEGWGKIKDYLEKKEIISGFKRIVLLQRSENLGAVRNIEELESFICERFDKFIFTEDDNEFSPNFLEYINKGLEKYQNAPEIYAICGYNYPIDMSGYEYNYYFSNEYSAWGCGCWKDKCNHVKNIIKQKNYLIGFCKKQPLSVFIKNDFRLLTFVRYVKEGYLGDAYITTYLQSTDTFCVFPKVSLVRNWGHDGTGVNCKNSNKLDADKYEQQIIQDGKTFEFGTNLSIKIAQNIKTILQEFYKTTLKSKIKNFALLLMIKSGL